MKVQEQIQAALRDCALLGWSNTAVRRYCLDAVPAFRQDIWLMDTKARYNIAAQHFFLKFLVEKFLEKNNILKYWCKLSVVPIPKYDFQADDEFEYHQNGNEVDFWIHPDYFHTLKSISLQEIDDAGINEIVLNEWNSVAHFLILPYDLNNCQRSIINNKYYQSKWNTY